VPDRAGENAVPKTYPEITVVVATRDRPGLLERAVASILGQDYPGRVECVVVYDHVDVRELDVPVGPDRSRPASCWGSATTTTSGCRPS
jgi:hypothetical protein